MRNVYVNFYIFGFYTRSIILFTNPNHALNLVNYHKKWYETVSVTT